jgi:hypothetical protein
MPSLVLTVHLATAIIISACGISDACGCDRMYDPVCATDGVKTKTFDNVCILNCDPAGKSNTGSGGQYKFNSF